MGFQVYVETVVTYQVQCCEAHCDYTARTDTLPRAEARRDAHYRAHERAWQLYNEEVLAAPRGRCEICKEPITATEASRLAQDIDFVEHHGHLIRRVLPTVRGFMSETATA